VGVVIVSSADRHDADVERQAARLSPASDRAVCPSWAHWNRAGGRRYTIGVEEELMLLDPSDFALVQSGEQVLRRLSDELRPRTAPETHASVIELNTGVHADVAGSVAELSALRGQLHRELRAIGLTAASAGAYPLAYSGETRVSGSGRSGVVADSMRMLVRREPTLALHVHIGVPDPDDAIRVLNGLRAAVPVLLALSANSPFSRGRDTGFASARTVIFQGFPRTGTARRFADYGDYVGAVDALIASGALPDPSFLWWDVRLQPALGTVEVRVMDAQSTVADSAPIIALVQSLARLALESEPEDDGVGAEVLAENRFLAARDGLNARLIAPSERRLVPARGQLNALVARCRAHAGALGCDDELDEIGRIATTNGAERQRAWARAGGLVELVKALSELFPAPGPRRQRQAPGSSATERIN
jgi:carboxylate-amine ligase